MQLEFLEARRMMSASIMQGEDGHVYITGGADGAHIFAQTYFDENRVTHALVSNDDAGTDTDFSGVTEISFLGDASSGEDSVTIYTENTPDVKAFMNGRADNDTLGMHGWGDVGGDAGDDTISVSGIGAHTGTASSTAFGGDGDDTIYISGDNGDGVFFGGKGDDTFHNEQSTANTGDNMYGDDGNDTFWVRKSYPGDFWQDSVNGGAQDPGLNDVLHTYQSNQTLGGTLVNGIEFTDATRP